MITLPRTKHSQSHIVGVQVQAAQIRDLEQLVHTARSGVSSMFRQGHGEDGAAAGGPPPQSRARATRGSGFYAAAGGPPPQSRAGATRGSSRPELQPDSLQQDEQEDDWGDDWDRAQEAQNHCGRTRFQNAIFASPPAGASLENLREWRVVEPDVAGSLHISPLSLSLSLSPPPPSLFPSPSSCFSVFRYESHHAQLVAAEKDVVEVILCRVYKPTKHCVYAALPPPPPPPCPPSNAPVETRSLPLLTTSRPIRRTRGTQRVYCALLLLILLRTTKDYQVTLHKQNT